MTVVTGPYLRATVLSGRQRLDVVLPTHRPVAEMLPAVLELLDISDPETTRVLHTDAGHAIEADRSLDQTGLRDGVVLHLVAVREIPAEPVVADLIDTFEAGRESFRRFDAAAQQWLLSVSGGVLLVLGWMGLASVSDRGPVLLAGSALGTWLLAVAGSSVRWRPVWVCLVAAALCLTVGALVATPSTVPQRCLLGLTALVAAVLVVGVCAERWRSALAASLVLVSAGSAAGLAWVLSIDLATAAGVGMATSIVVCGLLPQWALALSGAFTMDGRTHSGNGLRHAEVQRCLDEATRSLGTAVAANCLLLAVTASALAATAPMNAWAGALFAVLLLIWLCRIRHFPLILHRALVLGAALVAVTAWMVATIATGGPRVPWVSLTVLVLGFLALAGHRLQASALVAAVGRRWVRRVEVVGVLATVPLLVGLTGVYRDLLSTF